MIGLDSYSRQVFYLFGPHFDLYQSLNRLPVWNPQNCSMFPLAFVAGWLKGHWWGFISRNNVVWPTFLLMNVFIALKGSHFWFLFDFTAAGVVPCGGRMFPLAFVAGWLQGQWWSFISRNYVVWPTFLLLNVFIALKRSHFWFLFSRPAGGYNT